MTTLDDLERWGEAFSAFHARFADLFARRESREQMAKYLRGLLAPVERKNSWQVAEAVGDATPDRMQRLLYRVDWDVDAARDRLQAFVRETFGDPEGIGVLDETGFLGDPVETRIGAPHRSKLRWGPLDGVPSSPAAPAATPMTSPPPWPWPRPRSRSRSWRRWPRPGRSRSRASGRRRGRPGWTRTRGKEELSPRPGRLLRALAPGPTSGSVSTGPSSAVAKRLGGRLLLRTSEPTLSAEEVALGSKQLLQVEQA